MIKINLLGDTLAQANLKNADKGEPSQIYAEAEGASRSSLPIAGLIFGIILASSGGVYYVWLKGKVGEATRYQAELQRRKKDLEKYTALEKTFQSHKVALARKKEVMMGLKNAQHLPVHFLEELANCVPDDVWFKEVTQKGMSISIKGESSSFEAINLFRNNLQGHEKWFEKVNQPEANKVGHTVEFTISCDLKNAV
jgi:Tfp pilus assembly protein PilN